MATRVYLASFLFVVPAVLVCAQIGFVLRFAYDSFHCLESSKHEVLAYVESFDLIASSDQYLYDRSQI